jgi:hypothetical protein
MKIKAGDRILEGELNTHQEFVLPGNATLPKSVMHLDVTVDNATPQLLKKLRPFPAMVLQIPGGWPRQSQIVLQALFDCFSRAGNVSEGLIGDLIWGFMQCGIPPELTVHGLRQLEELKLVKFQAPDGQFVSLHDTASEKAWVRYQRPLLERVYEPEEKT